MLIIGRLEREGKGMEEKSVMNKKLFIEHRSPNH